MWAIIGDAINMRSFSALWYWVAVAVFWIWALGQTMGLPWGMVTLARRSPEGLAQLEAMAQLVAQRKAALWAAGQIWLVALMAALIGLLTALAFFYGVELAQAVWFLAVPIVLIWAGNLRAAHLVARGQGQGAALLRVMFWLQVYTQIVAFVFIMLTMFFAFFQLLLTGQLR